MNSILLGQCLIPLGLLLVYGFIKRRKRLPFPPGPKGLPIIGNLFDIPKSLNWIAYKRWSDQYKSDIIYLNVVGQSIVILNSIDVANDLLAKRSAIYSSRPPMPMVIDLMGYTWHFGFMPYGSLWAQHIKLFKQELNPGASARFRPHQIKAYRELLRRIRDSPERCFEHVRHAVCQSTVSMTYGIDILPENDPYIDVADTANSTLVEAAIPGAFLVDSMPILKYVPDWFPGAGFKGTAKKWGQYATDVLEMPFKIVKRNIENGTAVPSFVSQCLDKVHGEGQDAATQEYLIQSTAATIYSGAIDTTAAVMCTAILALVLHPKVQAKAQTDLHQVLGRERLPVFDDEPYLPYITAIALEAMRWMPPAPTGLPHFLNTEDVYNGSRIPPGSIVFANVWAILRDEAIFGPDTSAFKPERFLKDGKVDVAMKGACNAAFGFGRRACPGRHIAEASVWLALASILTCFTLGKTVNNDGSVIEPSGEYIYGPICSPMPFDCLIQSRSAEAEYLIHSSTDN